MPEQLCGKPAVARYVWPTMKTIDCCDEHARVARGVAAAMGFAIGALDCPPDATCTQHVESKRGE